jgi:aminoglycoside 3-N-acetyltransferase I
MSFAVRRLGQADVALAKQLNALFAVVFEDRESYASALPNEAYLQRVLGREEVIALVATADEQIVGGLVAYVLEKLEQERSEIYIYDLAVGEDWRRRGIATALIAQVQAIAQRVGSWVIYVQADSVDAPAVALYEKLGTREEVLHFDIAPALIR